jgi:hypothetical protein
VRGDWRKLHNDGFHKFYSLPFIIRMITSRTKWAEYLACMGEKGNVYRILVAKPEGRRPPQRPRCTWEDTEILL